MAKSRQDVLEELQDDKDLKGVFNIGLDAKTQWYLHTGHYGLNRVVSGAYWMGWPSGRVAELYGDPSTGKSILFMAAMTSMQRSKIYVTPGAKVKTDYPYLMLDDTEKVYVGDFCEKLGFDTKDVLEMKSSKTVEDHFTYALKMVEKINKAMSTPHTVPILIACDSIAQLSTKHEQKVGMEKRDMSKAGQIHAAWRLMSDPINEYQVIYLAANHVIDNVGVMYGPKKVTKGGSGTPFQASVRISLKYKSRFERNVQTTDETGKRGVVYGNKVIAEGAKNKITIPFQFTPIDIYYEVGIDPYSGLRDHFIRSGIWEVHAGNKKKEIPETFSIKGFDGTFEDKDFENFIIDKDVLGVKKAGLSYDEPVRHKINLGEVVEVDEEDGTTKEPVTFIEPAPPPEKPTRTPKV